MRLSVWDMSKLDANKLIVDRETKLIEWAKCVAFGSVILGWLKILSCFKKSIEKCVLSYKILYGLLK